METKSDHQAFINEKILLHKTLRINTLKNELEKSMQANQKKRFSDNEIT